MDIDDYCRNGRDRVDNLFTKDRFLRRELLAEMTSERYLALSLSGRFTIETHPVTFALSKTSSFCIDTNIEVECN